MPSAAKKIRYRLESYGVVAMTKTIPLLPRPVLLALAKALGRLAFWFDRRGRETGLQNIRAAIAANTLPDIDLKPARRQPATIPIPRFRSLSRPPLTAKNSGVVDADKPVDPSWLVGLDQDGALVLLGQPSQRRDQPPARIWQYNAERCSLKLFLYLDVVTVRYRTLFYEIDGVDAEDSNARRNCLNQILAGRADRRDDG